MLSNTFNVGGLPVNVYCRDSSTKSSKPAVILFLLHGRTQKAEDYKHVAEALVSDENEKKRELYVVSFDHRNHGHRLINTSANEDWRQGNDRHAIDMYAIQTGTARDVSFLIDFLPAYLFPNGERTVEEWGVTGISLGGHSTWISLAQEQRITFGIPIIGCPDFMALMTGRAEKWQKTPFAGSKYLPQSLVRLIQTSDPASKPFKAKDATNPFIGKKILVLSGEVDELVPWTTSQTFVEQLQVGDGIKKVIVEKNVGHTMSPAMLSELVGFVHEIL